MRWSDQRHKTDVDYRLWKWQPHEYTTGMLQNGGKRTQAPRVMWKLTANLILMDEGGNLY